MKKTLLAWLAFLCLPFLALAEETLPVPSGAGHFLDAETREGETYQVYQCEYEKERSGNAIQWTVYSERLAEAGWTVSEEKDRAAGDVIQGVTRWYVLEKNETRAYACFEWGYFKSKVLLTLYLPESAVFSQDPGPETSARPNLGTPPLSEAGWTFDFSSSLPDPAEGPVVCESCHGSGRCDACGGDGVYRNPYTGDERRCSVCDNGVCPVCDGTGIWE